MKKVNEMENIQFKNKIFESFVHLIAYTLTLSLVAICLKTIDIDNGFYGLFYFVASIIIYLLNKTIKPILFRLTIPITGITMGLFYPCINILILKITDYIMGNYFETSGIVTLFFTAILISLVNIIIEEIFIKPILRKDGKNE